MAKRNSKNTTQGKVSDDGFEMIGGGGGGTEMAIGEVVTGVYGGIVRTMPGQKRGTVIPFYDVGGRALLGGTVLRNRVEEAIKLGKLKEGKVVRVTRVEDGKKRRGQNAPKVYTLEVKRN